MLSGMLLKAHFVGAAAVLPDITYRSFEHGEPSPASSDLRRT